MTRIRLVGAVSLVALLTAACGGGGASKPAASTITVTNSASAAAEPDETADWHGKMIPTYEAATSPDAIKGRDLLESQKLLETMADGVNQSLKLPQDVPLVGRQCDTANAYWDPSDKTMTICYEDGADALDIYTKIGDPNPAEAATNAEYATFLHETGHMVIDLYQLPAVGREEDAADQLAAVIMLAPGPDGKVDPDSVKVVKDFAREFKEYDARDGDQISQEQLADVHSMNLTRMYNLECWVYGADPVANADLVQEGSLPQDRADGCVDEYQQMSDSWIALLSPYLK